MADDQFPHGFFAHRKRIAELPARDAEILRLAKAAVNAMGFACQGAEQGNERMEIRYQEQSAQRMRELELLLLGELSDPVRSPNVGTKSLATPEKSE